MPNCASCAAGPTPDSIMICGEPIEPAAMITSPRQRAERSTPSCRQRTPHAAPAVEHQPFDQTAGFQPQVLPVQHRLEESARRRPAPAALLVDVEIAGAFVVAGVEVVDRRDAVLRRRLAPDVDDVPAQAREFDAPFAADAVVLAGAEEAVLVLLEKRQHVVPRPAGQTQLAPVVVVAGLPAHIDHGVDRRRAADHLAARIIQAAAVEARLGFGLEHPVRARIADGEQIADRDVIPDPVVAAAGFEQQHAIARIGRQAVRQHAAGASPRRPRCSRIRLRARSRLPLPCPRPRSTLPCPARLAKVAPTCCAPCVRCERRNGGSGTWSLSVPIRHQPGASSARPRRTAMVVRLVAILGLFAALAGAPLPAAAQETITVFAAASLKNALDDAHAAFTKATGVKVVASYEASSSLAKQIEAGRARRCVHLGRSALDGLRRRQKADQDGYPRQSARQQTGADRAERFQARSHRHRPGLRHRQARRRRPHRGRRRQSGAGRALCQGGAGKARRLGRRRSRNWRKRVNVRATLCLCRARRDAARHRLRDRRQDRAEGEDRRRLSG